VGAKAVVEQCGACAFKIALSSLFAPGLDKLRRSLSYVVQAAKIEQSGSAITYCRHVVHEESQKELILTKNRRLDDS